MRVPLVLTILLAASAAEPSIAPGTAAEAVVSGPGRLSDSLASTLQPVELDDFCTGGGSPDDTVCIGKWIEAGMAPGVELRGSKGTYTYHGKFELRSNLRLVCTGKHRTRFRSAASWTALFFEAQANVENVHIEGCEFDANGSTANFLAFIAINPPPGLPRSRNIEIKGNRFRDSRIQGRMSAAQRQYILLLQCDDCRVLGNELTEGGRIKLGRPGSDLVIRGNRLTNVNDNAITVVDTDTNGGVSERIVIANNTITNPRGVGIFFGADGEKQTSPVLVTRDVTIEGNRITGDWVTCIAGTLPHNANDIRIRKNVCVKTGVCGAFPAGIQIRRTNGVIPRAQNIVIDDNVIRSNIGWIAGQYPPLDYGGIFVSGLLDDIAVTNNRVQKVGPRAIHFHLAADVINATVTNNTMTGGTLVIAVPGNVTGTLAPNTEVPN